MEVRKARCVGHPHPAALLHGPRVSSRQTRSWVYRRISSGGLTDEVGAGVEPSTARRRVGAAWAQYLATKREGGDE